MWALFVMGLAFGELPAGLAPSDILLNRFLKLFDLRKIAVLNGVHNAMRKVLVDDGLAKTVERGLGRGNLHPHIGAVFIAFNHALDVLQMPDDAGEAVELLLLFGRIVRMTVRMRMLMRVVVGMLMVVHQNTCLCVE